MYQIERTHYGFKLVFRDVVSARELNTWVAESLRLIVHLRKSFGVLVDMRAMKPLAADAQLKMKWGQGLYKENGMRRSCVVLADVTIAMQFVRLAKMSGIHEGERYVDASKTPNWEQLALDWIERSCEPPKLGKDNSREASGELPAPTNNAPVIRETSSGRYWSELTKE